METPGGSTLVVGTYERFLLGYGFLQSQASLARSFVYPAHKGVIHALTARDPFLVSGGGDEELHLYHYRSNLDLGTVLNPGGGGVQTAALFGAPPGAHEATHLLSGAADGSLGIWKAEDWTLAKRLAGHRWELSNSSVLATSKAVTGLAVHSSGLLALSTARDGQLRMWNLVRGKPQYKRQLRGVADSVQFLPDEGSYALVQDSTVSIHSTGEEGLLATLPHTCRVGALACLTQHEVLTGAEDGCLRLWDTRTPNKTAVLSFKAHARRLRGIVTLSEGHSVEGSLVASGSSDGTLRVWDYRQVGSAQPADSGSEAKLAEALCGAATEARITCMCCIPRTARQRAARAQAELLAPQGSGKLPVRKHETGQVSQAAPKRRQRHSQEQKSAKQKLPKLKQAPTLDGVLQDGLVHFADAPCHLQQSKLQRSS